MNYLQPFSAKFFVVLLALVIASATAGATGTGSKATGNGSESESVQKPFAVGERLTYSLRWGIVRAGTAVLEVHPMADFGGEEVYHFSLSIRTSRFVDTFYKVRDRIDGFARRDLDGSVLYLLKKEEGRNLRDVRVIYDNEAGLAQYSNFGDEQDPVEILPATLDPLSVLFAMRASPLKAGTEVQLPISDGRRASLGVGAVRKEERVRVPAGNFRAMLVEPDMQDVGGVFDKSGDSPMQIWFSADERRMPVRISSRVAVGSFHADLVEVEQLLPGEKGRDMANFLDD